MYLVGLIFLGKGIMFLYVFLMFFFRKLELVFKILENFVIFFNCFFVMGYFEN